MGVRYPYSKLFVSFFLENRAINLTGVWMVISLIHVQSYPAVKGNLSSDQLFQKDSILRNKGKDGGV